MIDIRVWTEDDFGPKDPLTIYGPYVVAMLVVMLAASASDPNFDIRVFVCFAGLIGMSFQHMYLSQSTWVTTGLWLDWVEKVYKMHEYLGLFNIVPVFLAVTGVWAAVTLLKPHFTKMALPATGVDLSAYEVLEKYAGYLLFAYVLPVILHSWPFLSSISFLLFIASYLFGTCMVIYWIIEDEKKRKAAAPATSTPTKGGITMSHTTHTRVRDFWRVHMFPREELIKKVDGTKMDFETFTKDVKGNPAAVRNNQILTLFRETLKAAHIDVQDNRTDIQKAY
jgi:hypothetical protein